jgi:hypothetical protein
MTPDVRWLDALKLPARVIAGLFLGSVFLLILDYFGVVNLGELHALARLVLIIAAVLCGALCVTAIGGLIYDARMQHRRTTLLSSRREIRRAEHDSDRAEAEARALGRLDYLSKDELCFVADCLRKNEQSFTAYVFSPPVSNLQAAGLVLTPGGPHHQDYYPYFFADFAWTALLERKDEFIAKDDEHTRREAAEKERERHSRRR